MSKDQQSIDERLERVLYEHRNGSLVGKQTSLINDLKQAFADDAGITTLDWVKSEGFAKVKKHRYRDEVGKEFTQYTISYPDGSGEFARVPQFPFMTGQEWYERFEKELRHDTKRIQNECPECGAPYNYLEAAHRASGLNKPSGGEEK